MSVSLAYSQDELVKSLNVAMKNSDAREISSYFGDMVNLKLIKEESSYSKSQAEVVLRDFFKNYPSTEFQIVHQGKSKEGGLNYIVGRYSLKKGSFRVYILIKHYKSAFYIDTLDFSEE